MTIAELIVKLGVKGEAEVKAGLKSVRQEVSSTGEAVRSVNASFSAMQGNLTRTAALFAGIGFGKVALDVAADADAMKRGIATQVGSLKELDAVYAQIRKTSLMPGIDMKQASNAFLQLKAVGFSADEAHSATRELANALASVGGSAGQMENVVRAISQMAGKTKVSQEEINQLTENLPTMGKVIQEAFGTRSTEAIQKMGITGEQGVKKILAVLARMPRASAGIRTEIEAATDSFQQMQVSIGMVEAKFLKAFGPGLQKAMGKVGEFFDNVPKYSTAISILGGVLGGAVVIGGIMRFIGAVVSLTKTIQMLGITTAIAEALATGGTSAIPALAGAASVALAGAAAGVYLGKQISDILNTTAPTIPTTGGGPALPSLGGSISLPGSAAASSAVPTGADGKPLYSLGAIIATSVSRGLSDGLRAREQWLGEIANNTRKTFHALDLRAETLGGGALARQGATGAERARNYSDAQVARFAGATSVVGGSKLEREIRKVTADEIRRRRGGSMRR